MRHLRAGFILLVVTVSTSLPVRAQLQPPEVTFAIPIRKTVAQWDEYTGQFESVRRVEVRPRVSGELVKIHFVDGQVVKAGDILFSLDRRPFENAVESARADVARFRAQLAASARDLDRAEKLAPSSVLTQRDLDQRKANHEVTVAQLQAAEAAFRNAELNLEWTTVRAPIDGRTSDRKIDAGNLVSGGQVGATLLTTILALHPIHVIFNVPEPDYARYIGHATGDDGNLTTMLGKPIEIRLAIEKGWPRTGRVNFLDNQLAGKSATIRVRAVVDNEDFALTPGMFARLRLFGGEGEALLIPDAAVVSDQSRKVVYVVGPENKVQAKPVNLGQIDDTLRVVMSGLSAADRVIIAGLANPAVRAGAVVTPMPGKIVAAAK